MISSQLKRALKNNIFNSNIYTRSDVVIGDRYVMYKYLKLPITDPILIPTNYNDNFYDYIVGDYLLLPITCNRNDPCIYIRRVMDVIKFITDAASKHIVKLDFNEKIYYGGYGLLLDENLIPIMMACNEGEFDSFYYTENSQDKRPIFKLTKPVIMINNNIFNNTHDTVNKYIISNLIPFFSSEEFYTVKENKIRNSFIIKDNSTYGNHAYVRAEVRITDTSKYVTKPTTPNASIKSEDICDELLNILKYTVCKKEFNETNV